MPSELVEHDWDLTPKQAIALQRELRQRLSNTDHLGHVERVAGVDVGFEAQGTITRAAVVVLDATTRAPMEQAVARLPTRMPYIPGLLSFREVPAVLDALQKLRRPPDLLMCDGHGIAHPRRMGIACHVGLLTGVPSIGVAKSRLTGQHGEVPEEKGN